MDDLISRRAAIKAIDDLPNCYNGYSDTYDKAYIIGTLEEVPSVDPKKVVEDYCIPRNLMVVGAECFRLFTEPKPSRDWNGWENGCGRTYDFQPKNGKWNDHTCTNWHGWHCSVCDYETQKRTNYCPNCGARMDVPDNDVGKMERSEE